MWRAATHKVRAGRRSGARRRGSAGTALALSALALARASFAQPAPVEPAQGVQRVAVLRLHFGGDVPEASRELFVARLVEGLAVARFQVVAGPSVTEALAEHRLERCADGGCYPRVAEALSVGYLLTGKIEEASKSYDIALTIHNGRTGDIIGGARERCEICGVTEAAEKVALATASLRARLEALARTPARVVVRSRPPGAQVRLDGKPIGRTPVDLELPGGQHRLSLALDRHHPVERVFTVVSGVDETLDLELLREPSGLPLRALGWLGVLGGAALVAGGVYAVVVDGREIPCVSELRDVNGRCPRVRDTDALAAGLTGLGAAMIGLGAVSLWFAAHEAPAADAGETALPIDARRGLARTVGVRWSGRF